MRSERLLILHQFNSDAAAQEMQFAASLILSHRDLDACSRFRFQPLRDLLRYLGHFIQWRLPARDLAVFNCGRSLEFEIHLPT
jgi:hypothetical protein